MVWCCDDLHPEHVERGRRISGTQASLPSQPTTERGSLHADLVREGGDRDAATAHFV